MQDRKQEESKLVAGCDYVKTAVKDNNDEVKSAECCSPQFADELKNEPLIRPKTMKMHMLKP